jgi:hypothetical protein
MFMRIGQAAHAATCAKHGSAELRGTLNLDWLAKAAVDIPDISWVEKWLDFARVAVTDQRGFNAAVQSRSVDDDYGYGLTPLLRHPVIQVASDRFIAVDWVRMRRSPILCARSSNWITS